MAARAVRSFRAQAYENKRIFILDTSVVDRFPAPFDYGLTIGALRNYANQYAKSQTGADIFVHWDDDDYSHPNRIAEQVALLQQSGANCVGYGDMLFWRTGLMQFDPRFGDQGFGAVTETEDAIEIETGPLVELAGDAWLYTGPFLNYALGTSLCYWRRTWEQRPFRNENQGVEEKWCADLKVLSVTSLDSHPGWGTERDGLPRMIASIHGGNTSTGYDLERHVAMGSQQWKRVPTCDEYCRERMTR